MDKNNLVTVQDLQKMKEEIIKKLNFMNMLYGAGRKDMFEEQWAELSKLINALPALAVSPKELQAIREAK